MRHDQEREEGEVTIDPAVRNGILARYVIVAGSNGYRAAYPLGGINPRFGGERTMAAHEDALGQLGPGGTAGFARMAVPGDEAGGRYLSDLINSEAVDLDAEPASATGLWA